MIADPHLGPLAKVSPQTRAKLLALGAVRIYPRGQILLRDRAQADHLIIVQSGLVVAKVGTAPGRRLTSEVLGCGGLVGLMALAGVSERMASTYALTDVRVLAFDAERLRGLRHASLREGDESLDHVVMCLLGGAIRWLSQQLVDVALVPQPVRLRRLLLRFAPQFEDGRILLTHEQLGEALGAQRSTVSALLAAEVKAGRIRTGRGWVEIVDLEAVRLVSR